MSETHDSGRRELRERLLQQADRHTACGKNCADAALLREAAAALSSAPLWQPIETAPKMRTVLLFAVTHINDDGSVGNWKMATGSWHTGYEDPLSKGRGFTPWEWGGHQLKSYEVQPTHWMLLPSAPLREGQGTEHEPKNDTRGGVDTQA